jgi:DNA primase
MELNKLLINERNKKTQEKVRDSDTKEVVEAIADLGEPGKANLGNLVQLQEREAIRLLLNYAESNYEDQRLVDFMLNELEDVEFSEPVLNDIYRMFKEGAARNETLDTLYFMEHGSDAVKSTVADLTTPRYDTSKHWSEKYHIYFPKEPEIIQNVAYTNVLRLKFRLIQKLMEENLAQMKQATNDDDLEKYFTIHEQLKGAEKEIASILGIVISK